MASPNKEGKQGSKTLHIFAPRSHSQCGTMKGIKEVFCKTYHSFIKVAKASVGL